jgi:photosystem II reaction center protein PsbP
VDWKGQYSYVEPYNSRNMPKVILSGLLVVTVVLSLFSAVLSGFTLQIAMAQQNITSITPTNNSSTNFLTYSNYTYGIKIQYPSSWPTEESHNQSSNDIVKFSSPAGTAPASLNIIGGKPALQSIPLQLYINASIYVLRQSFNNFSLIDSNSTNLAGFPAHKIVYTGIIPSSGLELKFMQILTIKDGKDFVITSAALPTDFSAYLPTFQKMIDSFAFIPVTTPAASNATSPIPSVANQTGLINSTQTIANFETARDQYLVAWNQTTLHSTFDTFIEQGSATGYGVYVQHPSVFKPGDSIVLYVEPVGFAHKPLIDNMGNTLYQINFTADIIISDNQGRQLAALKDIPAGSINSHHKNTEMFLTVKLDQKTPFPIGDYKITYIVKDASSGKSFQIVKPIKIANFVSSGIP